MINEKTKFENVFLLLIFIFFFSQAVSAQVSSDQLGYNTDVSRRGTTAGAMLEIGVGARAEALGGAFVAIADDPSALYWNPAGIVNVPVVSLQASKTEWFVETNFNTLDLILPIPMISSALGIHIAMMDYGENPVRSIFRPEGTGETYSASDLVAGLYYALAITDRVSVGLGAKYFQQSIWHVKGSTIAADMSILFETPLDGLKVGGTISNLGPSFSLSGRDLTRVYDIDGRKDEYFNNDNVAIQLATEDYPLPLLFRFGLAYEWELDRRNSLILAGNINHPSNDVQTVDLGVEAKLLNMAYLRAGYRSLFADYSADGLTLGAGLRYKVLGAANLTFDYSWTDWTVLSSVNRFTVGISGYY
ncbi:PorV/PorQ family protein [candidate division KSB1 bacterium]|nr:PorV/PorQ family protein [candidate division KSB1 bacterium]